MRRLKGAKDTASDRAPADGQGRCGINKPGRQECKMRESTLLPGASNPFAVCLTGDGKFSDGAPEEKTAGTTVQTSFHLLNHIVKTVAPDVIHHRKGL